VIKTATIYTRYALGAIVSIALLPVLYFQGKRIRREVPTLPEATGPEGIAQLQFGQPFTLLCLGESTIAGVGVKTHVEGFAGTLAETLAQGLGRSVNWRVYARSGYTAERVTAKIVPKISEIKADLIVIGLGGNDAFTLNRPWRWRVQIRHLIQALRLRFPETPIVFANMPPIKTFPAFTPIIKFVIGNLVEILGETLSEEVKNHPKVHYRSQVITLEDWITRLSLQVDPADFFSDGVHPSSLTYQTWARDLAAGVLEEVL
jgi:lysophospholipase L1-like esterase